MSWRFAAAYRRRLRQAQGQVALFAPVLLLVLVGGFAAVAVDIGQYVRGRQQVENAVDAAALAGAQALPDNGTTAAMLARQYAAVNGHDPHDPSAALGISFRCIVGDRNSDGQPDAADIPAVCPQVDPSTFGCAGGLCVSPCNFAAASNKCNTIVADGSKYVPFSLASVLGVSGLSTGTTRGSACRGPCGAASTSLLDVVIIIDRTYSMFERGRPEAQQPLTRVKDAALAVLASESFNPAQQHVALVVLPQSRNDDPYTSVSRSDMLRPDRGKWLLVPLSDDYKNADGTLNMDSALVKTIKNLQLAPDTGSAQTNLQEPVKRAHLELQNHGRSGVAKGILLFSDGAPNLPQGANPCDAAVTQATLAKDAGIEIFSIGFALSSRDICGDSRGRYVRAPGTRVLADMASPPADDNGCTAQENADEDHFFCEPGAGDLTVVFQQAATALVAGARIMLIHVPMDK